MQPIRCSVQWFWLAVSLIFIGTVLLCSLCITTVSPYFVTKHWIDADCVIRNVTLNTSSCSCDRHRSGDDCADDFPCLRVQTTFTTNVRRDSFTSPQNASHVITDGTTTGSSNDSSELAATAYLYQTLTDAFRQTVGGTELRMVRKIWRLRPSTNSQSTTGSCCAHLHNV